VEFEKKAISMSSREAPASAIVAFTASVTNDFTERSSIFPNRVIPMPTTWTSLDMMRILENTVTMAGINGL
jgi:hypothetical protein